MRVDRSHFRVVCQLQRGGDWDGWVGCVFALGTVQFEFWPKTPRSESLLREWLDYIFLPRPATYAEVLEQIEH